MGGALRWGSVPPKKRQGTADPSLRHVRIQQEGSGHLKPGRGNPCWSPGLKPPASSTVRKKRQSTVFLLQQPEPTRTLGSLVECHILRRAGAEAQGAACPSTPPGFTFLHSTHHPRHGSTRVQGCWVPPPAKQKRQVGRDAVQSPAVSSARGTVPGWSGHSIHIY